MNAAARAVVDSAALRHNLGTVRKTAPDSQVMAVVKANAYGHGLVEVARALAAADAFAVARLDEAVALRDAGLTHRIVLLEGVLHPDQLSVAAALRLETVVHCAEQLSLLEQASLDDPLRAWLKIDTGMHRLGFPPGDAAQVAERLMASGALAEPPVFMTHLACADEPGEGMTHDQLTAFEVAVAGLPGDRSAANSAAILAYPESHMDWVRPGIMLYGVSPFETQCGEDLGLRPAMTLSSPLIAIKQVAAGGRVGYGATWTAAGATRIGIAAIGYGDGYPRCLGSSDTPVLLGGRRAEVIGRISMDMIAIDLSDVPDAGIGDEVTLWGPDLPVELLAARAGTIGYELLCGVTRRVDVTHV